MDNHPQPPEFQQPPENPLYDFKGKEKFKGQFRKGILEYCVLLALSRSDAYASELIGAFKHARLIVVEGTLYPLLTRLKNEGMLAYRWQESTSGPPRKYYYLTETGREWLRELDSQWDEIAQAIDILRNNPELKTPSPSQPYPEQNPPTYIVNS